MKAQIALFLSLALASFAARADFEVYFLRHGETTWNRAKLLQGSVAGTVLTPKGERMAEATAAGLTAAGIAFDRVYTSPYARARRTAEIISEKGGFARPVDEPRIREMCFGTYEGLKYVKGRYFDDNLRKFFEGEDGYEPRGEGAESFGQVQARLRDFLENELKPLDGKVTRVLCVAHSLILKSLVRELADASVPASAKRTLQPNCCVHVVKFANGKFSLGETSRIFYDPAAFAGPSGPLMVAHRGDYPDCPEGSRPAYSNAVARASDIVKLDVNPSRDGVTIMSHDTGFKRTMGWNVKIGDVDYAEILKHEFLPKGAFAHERVVTLPEALAVVKYVPEFWIDFKTFNPAFCEQVLREFAAAGIDRGRIMCATYTTAALEYLKAHHPDIRRVGHMDFRLQDGRWSPSFLRRQGVTYAAAADGEPYAPELLNGILDYAKRLGLHGVNMCPEANAVTPGLVKKLKESGLWVSIALIHTHGQAETFARHGHDCVVTRDVRVVRPVLAEGAAAADAPSATAAELKNGTAFALANVPAEIVVRRRVGEPVRFSLEENMTTGFKWDVEWNASECEMALDRRAAASGLCGAAGSLDVTVTSKIYTPARVEFRYHRPWEKNVKPFRTLKLIVYTVGEAKDPCYPNSPVNRLLKRECEKRGIVLVDWHLHIRGGMTPELALKREKASGIRSTAMENHGREWEIFDNARLRDFAARSRKVNPAMPVGIQVNDRDWFRQIDAETRAQFDYILADTMIMGTLPSGRANRLWMVKEIPDPDKWMEEYFAHVMQVMDEPISIYANATYLPTPIAAEYDRLWTEDRMRAVIAKAVEKGIALEIQAESPFPRPKFLKLAKEMGAKFSFGTNNFDPGPKDLSRWLEAITWLDLGPNDIWTPAVQRR